MIRIEIKEWRLVKELASTVAGIVTPVFFMLWQYRLNATRLKKYPGTWCYPGEIAGGLQLRVAPVYSIHRNQG